MTVTQNRYAKRGFTLMELMIVIMIIGLLSAVLAPTIISRLQSAKKGIAKTTMRSVKDAINMYQIQIGHLPTSLKDLIKEPKEEKDRKKWREHGQFIEKEEAPEDPWNNAFSYKVTPGAKHPYELYSRGPNGAEAPKEEWISVWDE